VEQLGGDVRLWGEVIATGDPKLLDQVEGKGP
jgi:hypothetical protein